MEQTQLIVASFAIGLVLALGSLLLRWQGDKSQSRWETHLTSRGYRKLGLSGRSNIRDEYDTKYVKGTSKDGDDCDNAWMVKALLIHPIKSCAPIELDEIDIGPSGAIFDREFAFAELLTPQTRLDAPEAAKQPRWTFRTLRQPGFEKFVHVRPEIWVPAATRFDDKMARPHDGYIVVKYPFTPTGRFVALQRWMSSKGLISPISSFLIPLSPPRSGQYPIEEVTIWKDNPRWLNYGVYVPEDFKTYLGVQNPLTLFRVDHDSYRQLFRCAPRKDQIGYQPVIKFMDAYPLHMLNLASVRDVGSRIQKDIPQFTIRRFRCNIVVTGPSAYNEDDWKRMRIGEHEIYCACHTIRCRLPNVDPDTAFRHPTEPDSTLKSFRCIDDGDPKNAALGLQLVPADAKPFQVRVGDRIEVLERGEHHYIKQ